MILLPPTDIDKDYVEVVDELIDKTNELLKERSWNLEFEFPPVFLEPNTLISGEMISLVTFATNEESEEWIQILDERTGHKCTINMFLVTVIPLLNRKTMN